MRWIVVTLIMKHDEGRIHANRCVSLKGIDFHFDFDRFHSALTSFSPMSPMP